MPSRPQPKPSNRQPGESETHYAWFRHYLGTEDQHGRRSTRLVSEHVQKSWQFVNRVARRHDWRGRAVEVDRAEDRRVRGRADRAIRALARRNVQAIEEAWELSALALGRLREMLEWPLERERSEPISLSDGTTIHRVIREPARWNYATVARLARVVVDLQVGVLRMTEQLQEATRPGAAGGTITDPELAEAACRSLAEYYARKASQQPGRPAAEDVDLSRP